ncbi:MAG: hypothetical protein ACK52S_18935 [Pirellula sp.]|jgi:hypothetical protein
MSGSYWQIPPRVFAMVLLLTMVPCSLVAYQMVGGSADRLPATVVKIHEGLEWIEEQAVADPVPLRVPTDRTCLGFQR